MLKMTVVKEAGMSLFVRQPGGIFVGQPGGGEAGMSFFGALDLVTLLATPLDKQLVEGSSQELTNLVLTRSQELMDVLDRKHVVSMSLSC